MESEFIRLFQIRKLASKKEQVYQKTSGKFDVVFSKAEKIGKKIEENLKQESGIVNNVKFFLLMRKHKKLLDEAEFLNEIAKVQLAEWKAMIDKI